MFMRVFGGVNLDSQSNRRNKKEIELTVYEFGFTGSLIILHS